MMRAMLGLALFVCCAATVCGAATIELAEEFPVRGTPVEVRLSGPAGGESYTLTVTYRPNSETAMTEEIGTFSPDGRVLWTPLDAGITSLGVAGGDGAVVATKNVAVRFDSVPVSGILVFLFAGLLLFGGATVSMRRALEG